MQFRRLSRLDGLSANRATRWLALAALGLVLVLPAVSRADSLADLIKRTSTRSLNIAVVGDSVANDLGNGMEDLFRDRPNIKVVKKTRFATGLVRTDYYNWNKVIQEFLAGHRPDVMVVVMGGNDRQPIRARGHRLPRFSKAWYAEYERRVAHFMAEIKSSGAKVYWVGLPPVRSDQMTHDYRTMNAVYQRQAAKHGFTYISVWQALLDSDGEYTSFGKSLRGVRRKLRQEDGMHFTEAGKLRLAAYVARQMGLRQ